MTVAGVTELLREIDESKLTEGEKLALLWKAVMGYGTGTARIPGLLETAAKSQKQTEIFSKVGLLLITVFGSLLTHQTIAQFVTVILRIVGFH